MTTKIHALTDAHGLPLELVLTPGQAADCPAAAKLLGRLREGTILLADKAYDADWLRRSIAARYEKHASNFLAMLKLAAVRLWLKHYESMT